MRLTDYLAVLRKRWLPIVLVVLLGLIGAGAASWLVAPQYTADTRVFVSTRPATATATDLVQGSDFAQQQVSTYAQLVSTPLVLEGVIADLRLDRTVEELADQITAEAPLDTSLITMTVTDSDPELVVDLTDRTAASLIAVIGTLEATGDGSASPVRVTVVQPATVPTSPSSPNVPLNLGLGLLVGLTVGMGLALLADGFDTTVRSERDVLKISPLPYLGGIAYDPDAKTAPLLTAAARHHGRAEAFRQVRTNLQFVSAAHHVRSFVVTSSVIGEGKTTTAANLAITLASAGARVVLVEGDLRRPRLGDYLGLEGAAGLTTVLVGRATLGEVTQRWGTRDRVDVVLAGQSPPNPSELLGSTAMSELIGALEAAYDIVIVDAPPLLPVTDAAVIGRIVGGVLVVVGSGTVNHQQLTRSLEALDRVGARLLGHVVNMLPSAGSGASGYSSYAYLSDDTHVEDDDAAEQLPPRPAGVAARPLGGSDAAEGTARVEAPFTDGGAPSAQRRS